MAYPTRADLVAASSVDALTALAPGDQDQLRVQSIAAIEAFCRQRFTATVATRRVNSNGTRVLPLDKRLAAITALEAEGSSLDQTDVVLSEDRDALYLSAALGGTSWVTRALWDGMKPVFPNGYAVVSITGTWGWLDAEMPANDLTTPVAIALRKDMEDQALSLGHGLIDTVRAQARMGMPNISEGPLSASVDADAVPLGGEVRDLLIPYIWQPQPVMA